jgi:hypothetical protein
MRAVDERSGFKPGFPHHQRVNDYELQRAEHLHRVKLLAAALPADAVISHESAAVVLGYPVYALPAAVKVTRTRGRGVRTSDVHVHVAQLRPKDIVVVDGVQVTSGARTTVDLARRLPFRESLVVADGAMRRRVSRAEMNDVLRHQWTWPRIRAAMLTVRHANGKAESALESVVRSRFIELGLPMPELQMNIFAAGRWIARVDFDWSAYNAVGEADGRVKYLEDELWREKVRQEALEDTDREVIRWTWRTAHAPDDEFAARVWRKLRRGLYLRELDAG